MVLVKHHSVDDEQELNEKLFVKSSNKQIQMGETCFQNLNRLLTSSLPALGNDSFKQIAETI